jgi:imidazolonepropionase-like amidohydrolase
MKITNILIVAVSFAATLQAQVAVRAETLHTMTGQAIQDGIVVITDGKISAVGAAADVLVPDGYELLRAKVATPGIVDAHSVVGLAGYLNQDQDQDQLERSAPMQPELRALDAYNGGERLVEWLRGFGITTIHTGHGPGALISGQTIVVKTTGNSVEDAVLDSAAMIAVTLGEGGLGSDGKSPGNRSKAIAMLRGLLIEAGGYARKRADADESKRPARDLRLEAMASALAGEMPLLVTVHRARDILATLRVASEFNHPPMVRTGGERENATFEQGKLLADAGVLFAYQSGFESYVPKTRVVLLEAAHGAAYGLGAERAMRAITIDAARLLGVQDRVGSLEVGKDGDVALYDGDPFEYASHCITVVINGVVVSREAR